MEHEARLLLVVFEQPDQNADVALLQVALGQPHGPFPEISSLYGLDVRRDVVLAFVMLPSSQTGEPPECPGRFSPSGARVQGFEVPLTTMQTYIEETTGAVLTEAEARSRYAAPLRLTPRSRDPLPPQRLEARKPQ